MRCFICNITNNCSCRVLFRKERILQGFVCDDCYDSIVTTINEYEEEETEKELNTNESEEVYDESQEK